MRTVEKRWERILNSPICFGDWNCLIETYEYPNGKRRFRNCPYQEECRQERNRQLKYRRGNEGN